MTIFRSSLEGSDSGGGEGAYTDTPLFYNGDLGALSVSELILDIDELDPTGAYEELHIRYGEIRCGFATNMYVHFSDNDRTSYAANMDGIRVRQGENVNTIQQFTGVSQILFATGVGRTAARATGGAIIIRNHRAGKYMMLEGRSLGVDSSTNEGIKVLTNADSHITDIKFDITFNFTDGYFAVFGRKHNGP